MKIVQPISTLLLVVSLFSSCTNNQSADQTNQQQEDSKTDTPRIKGEDVTYSANNTTSTGYVAYDENKQGARPVVLVVPEWWGLNDYVRNRARQLAELGYLAMAVDMYGGRKNAANPQEAQQLATPFYQNPQTAKNNLDAALNRVKQYSQADTAKVAAIGYCFGGAVVLNYARLGAPIDGVVSFHGNLVGVPPRKDSLKASILVCHGAADPFVLQQEVETFKKQMDSVNANYEFKAYPDATHAFTNPEATENGKKFNLPIAYNAAADSASWNDMKAFFGRIFR